MKVYCTRIGTSGLLLLAALAGCQEMTFKAGAGPGDFAAAEKACAATGGGSDDTYASCMNARGFKVHRRSASIFAGDNAPAAVAAAPAASSETNQPARAIAGGADAAAQPAPASPAPGVAPQKPAVPVGPVEVSSWWKLGGSAGEFTAARRACIAELKEPPSATVNENVASAALLACLRRAGWYGIKK